MYIIGRNNFFVAFDSPT